MFDQVFEILRKTSDAALQGQQEFFKKWTNLYLTGPWSPSGWTGTHKYQKKWAEVATELTKKQYELLETQFSAGLRSLEDIFRLPEAKNPEELRAKTFQLWQKTFECMREVWEAQLRDFQCAMAKVSELTAA
jgi:hypothetical protein